MTYWEINHPNQLIFHSPLPDDVEVRGLTGTARWVLPVMVRATKFPMTSGVYPLQAKQLIKEVRHEIKGHGLVVWCWSQRWDEDPKVQLAFFRNTTSSWQKLGLRPENINKPDWLIDLEDLEKSELPTVWDRLDDELV